MKSHEKTPRVKAKELAQMSDAEFFVYLNARMQGQAPAGIISVEINTLISEFFKRMKNHEDNCIKLMEENVESLSNILQGEEIPKTREYTYILKYLLKQMLVAETQDELELYYGSFAEITREISQKLGEMKISAHLMEVLQDYKNTRFIHLETEKEHRQGAYAAVLGKALGAATYAPVPGAVFAAFAWGTWAAGLTSGGLNASFTEKPPTLWERTKQFLRSHRKELGGGLLLAGIIGALIPFVGIPILISAGVLLGFAGAGVSLGVTLRGEKIRDERINQRMDYCVSELDNVALSQPSEQPKAARNMSYGNTSYALVIDQLDRQQLKTFTENIKQITRECLELTKKPKHLQTKIDRNDKARLLKIIRKANKLGKSKKRVSAKEIEKLMNNLSDFIAPLAADEVGKRGVRLNGLLDELNYQWKEFSAPPKKSMSPDSTSPSALLEETEPAPQSPAQVKAERPRPRPKLSPGNPGIN